MLKRLGRWRAVLQVSPINTTAIHEAYMPHSDCYCLYAQTVQLCITQSIMSVLHTLPLYTVYYMASVSRTE